MLPKSYNTLFFFSLTHTSRSSHNTRTRQIESPTRNPVSKYLDVKAISRNDDRRPSAIYKTTVVSVFCFLFFSFIFFCWDYTIVAIVPPSVTATNQLVGARQGDINITLECHCESFPKPVVYWLRHSTGDVVVNGNLQYYNEIQFHSNLSLRLYENDISCWLGCSEPSASCEII